MALFRFQEEEKKNSASLLKDVLIRFKIDRQLLL